MNKGKHFKHIFRYKTHQMCYILYYISGLIKQIKLVQFFFFSMCLITIGNIFVFIFPQNNNSVSQGKKQALEYTISAIWKQELKLIKWPTTFILFSKFCIWLPWSHIHPSSSLEFPFPSHSSLIFISSFLQPMELSYLYVHVCKVWTDVWELTNGHHPE